MIAQLSYWIWVIVFVCSLVLALILMRLSLKGSLDPNAPIVRTLGGAAVLAMVSGTVEGANSGLLVGKGIEPIISFMASLAFLGAFVGFWAFMAGMGIIMLYSKVTAKTE